MKVRTLVELEGLLKQPAETNPLSNRAVLEVLHILRACSYQNSYKVAGADAPNCKKAICKTRKHETRGGGP